MRARTLLVIFFALAASALAPPPARAVTLQWQWPAEYQDDATQPDPDTLGNTPWSYRYAVLADADGSYGLMTRETSTGRWTEPGDPGTIIDGFLHPGSSTDAVLTWLSPIAGQVRISGTVADGDAGGGDGVRFYIHRATTQLFSADLANGGSASYDVLATVSAGDPLFFRVNMKGSVGYDTTTLFFTIAAVPEPGAAGLALAGVLAALSARRRRRAATAARP